MFLDIEMPIRIDAPFAKPAKVDRVDGKCFGQEDTAWVCEQLSDESDDMDGRIS